MAALKEISFSCQLLAGIEVRTAKASCHWPLLSHALIAAVKTADLGCPVDGTPAHLQLVNKLIQRIGCSRQAEPHEFRASFSSPRKPAESPQFEAVPAAMRAECPGCPGPRFRGRRWGSALWRKYKSHDQHRDLPLRLGEDGFVILASPLMLAETRHTTNMTALSFRVLTLTRRPKPLTRGLAGALLQHAL